MIKLLLFPLTLFIYSLFTYLFVDPNLVLSSHPLYWNTQNWMWQFAATNRFFISMSFLMLISLLFVVYLKIIKSISNGLVSWTQLKTLILVSVIILTISYPALSHDIYNYMFNAKMVRVYKENPHQMTALDFPEDSLIKHMHNVHTPAPYGYGFTAISLVPSYLGQDRLKSTILLFRFLMIGGLVGMLWIFPKLMKQRIWNLGTMDGSQKMAQIALFALNPLVLIETVGNIHNDIIMMFLALTGLWLVVEGWTQKKSTKFIFGCLLFGLSVWIKLATVVLVAGFIGFLMLKYLRVKILQLPEILSLCLLAPLTTLRSQRFLPWYMIWSASFLPLMKDSILRKAIIAFTFSAMLGYLPYMYYAEHSTTTYWLRTTISFTVPLLIIFFQSVWSSWSKKLKAS